MKLCRFNQDRLGVVLDNEIADITSVIQQLPAVRYPLPRHDPLIAHLAQLRPSIEAALSQAERIPLSQVSFLSPVANPGKLVAAPVNYLKHLQEVLGDSKLHHNNSINEIQKAGLFLKATSSLVGASHGIEINQPERRTDHEIELAVVIGKTAKNVSASEALSYVAGYTIGLDITIRGPEERSMRKSPDTYSILGPWMVTADELQNPDDLGFELTVNGETRQKSNTSDLIIGVAGLIEFATRFYTLYPGDIIYTGTPEGVGQIKAGDAIHGNMEGIGDINVTVQTTSGGI